MASYPPPGKVQIIKRGVVATMKSGGVRSLVEQAVSRIAAGANAQAVSRRPSIEARTRALLAHRDPDAFASDPYEGKVKTGRYTVFGAVDPATVEGAYDGNQHHTLDSYNH